LMLLAGLILLAACANLGSLFAARAADRSREVALRLALGAGRLRILRQLFTEAVLISLIGGAVGLWGSVALLRGLSVWQPLPTAPLQVPVHPDANVYAVALLLSLASGFLFGAVPVRQALHTDPYQVIKSGSTGAVGRRMTVRDLLLVVQIAICAVLVTSSLVAVRGLVRSLHSNFGFEPQNALLVETALSMAGYSADRAPAVQKRMINALEAIPGVKSVGLVDRLPLYYGANSTNVFADGTTDLKPANAAAEAMIYNISPEYFDAARTTLLEGRSLNWHDDKNAPRVAVVNREFASKIFGSAANAMGKYFNGRDGTRIQVVGIVADGKYASLAEDPQPAMFLPILQSPSTQTCLVVRSDDDPQQLLAAIKSTVQDLDAGLPFDIRTWNQELESALFPSRMATMSLGVLGVMGAMLSITGIFGMAAYSVSKRKRELGIRMALGAQPKEVLKAALGRAFKLLAVGSVAGLLLGILASRVLASIVYQATPRDPLVLAGVVLAMLLLGLLATWIPAQRALSIDPVILLREE
jgi:predicted permease